MISIFTRKIRANNTIHIPLEVMQELGLNQDDLIQVTVKLASNDQKQNSDQMQILIQNKS